MYLQNTWKTLGDLLHLISFLVSEIGIEAPEAGLRLHISCLLLNGTTWVTDIRDSHKQWLYLDDITRQCCDNLVTLPNNADTLVIVLTP